MEALQYAKEQFRWTLRHVHYSRGQEHTILADFRDQALSKTATSFDRYSFYMRYKEIAVALIKVLKAQCRFYMTVLSNDNNGDMDIVSVATQLDDAKNDLHTLELDYETTTTNVNLLDELEEADQNVDSSDDSSDDSSVDSSDDSSDSDVF